MKPFWACVLLSTAVCAHSQTVSKSVDSSPSQVSVADFGLAYPLSNDWVRATELLRRRVESSSPAPNFDILLAAVYVPKSNLSANSPFFSLRAYRQPATDCKKNLETMIANPQGKKDQPEGGVQQFSSAGRDYFRVNLAQLDHRFASARYGGIWALRRTERWGARGGSLKADSSTARESEGVEWGYDRPPD